ncbi:hypothetical protein BT63DRAFT_480412 [Microthyrium microscopicum]|uniref:Box C/D snoRNA protein 1 n=1 Tax=Microthyrium microscopicum TaxID=703497 RepID=A0A6A6U727_9PEZI|nr:hypothetical protein BT63DRAFT_480412 [Microthyrium microscopicum]
MDSGVLGDLCSVCHTEQPKYRCPRCSTRTCSLECSQRHKKRAPCSGVRDPTAFIKKSDLATPQGVDHDYNFISGLERNLEKYDLRKIQPRYGYGQPDQKARREQAKVNKTNHERKKFLDASRSSGVKLLRAPAGMQRALDNSSRVLKRDTRSSVIVWTVEWLYEDGSRRLRGCYSNDPLHIAFQAAAEDLALVEPIWNKRKRFHLSTEADVAPSAKRPSLAKTSDQNHVPVLNAGSPIVDKVGKGLVGLIDYPSSDSESQRDNIMPSKEFNTTADGDTLRISDTKRQSDMDADLKDQTANYVPEIETSHFEPGTISLRADPTGIDVGLKKAKIGRTEDIQLTAVFIAGVSDIPGEQGTTSLLANTIANQQQAEDANNSQAVQSETPNIPNTLPPITKILKITASNAIIDTDSIAAVNAEIEMSEATENSPQAALTPFEHISDRKMLEAEQATGATDVSMDFVQATMLLPETSVEPNNNEPEPVGTVTEDLMETSDEVFRTKLDPLEVDNEMLDGDNENSGLKSHPVENVVDSLVHISEEPKHEADKSETEPEVVSADIEIEGEGPTEMPSGMPNTSTVAQELLQSATSASRIESEIDSATLVAKRNALKTRADEESLLAMEGDANLPVGTPGTLRLSVDTPKVPTKPSTDIAEDSAQLKPEPQEQKARHANLIAHYQFYLLKPRTSSKKKVLIPVNPKRTIQEILKGKAVLEFPTFHIFQKPLDQLPDEFILEKDYFVELAKQEEEMHALISSMDLPDLNAISATAGAKSREVVNPDDIIAQLRRDVQGT